MNHVVQTQPEPKFQERRLTRRLRNWGLWLNHENHVAPRGAICISIEARYQEEALGDVMEEQNRRAPKEMPDAPDAENMQKLISRLDSLEQYVLAAEYGGVPCVMRWRRIGDFAMRRALENAHVLLQEAIKQKK